MGLCISMLFFWNKDFLFDVINMIYAETRMHTVYCMLWKEILILNLRIPKINKEKVIYFILKTLG